MNKKCELKQVVYEQIKHKIEYATFSFGEKISEANLAAEFNTSKTPVREALQALSYEGLVQIKQRSGTFVIQYDKKKTIDVFEHRLIIETSALKLAYERNGLELYLRMQDIYEKMLLAINNNHGDEYYQLDCELHSTIVELADNAYLEKSYGLTVSYMKMLFHNMGSSANAANNSIIEHFQITEAIKNRDLNKALFLLENHLSIRNNTYLKTE